jgi:haloacetate dehalogenase
MSHLFPHSSERRFITKGAEIFVRIAGAGPPLLLIHGFPQTHAMWHRIAPELMQRFTIVMPDLRGYGQSSCPPNDPDNSPYSKRAMAEDMTDVMAGLGHNRFAVVGHDRGARVAYRLALDMPQLVKALVVLDIVPTWNMWSDFTVKLAMKTYHWLFLAQPHPLPEMLIDGAPAQFLEYTLASWTKTKDLSAFGTEALAEYRKHYTSEHIHATCNDYRAGQTYDFRADEEDRAKGRKIACPTLALWGDAGIPSETSGPLDQWREWCESVSGHGIDSGHFIPEENPSALLAALLPFMDRHGR